MLGTDGVRRVATDTKLSSDVIGLIVNDTMFLARKTV